MQQAKPTPAAFRIVAIILVVSGVGQVVASFYFDGIVGTVLGVSGGMEVVVGGVFWFWAERVKK
jgi:hypothetical protein